MPYYAGDYYAGDPGLGGALAKLGSGLGPLAKSFGQRALGFLKTPGGAAAAAGAAGLAAGAGLGAAAGEEPGRRYRRMNPLNIHAARRAIRRLQSFERTARKVYHFVRRPRGRSGFKVGRRRRR